MLSYGSRIPKEMDDKKEVTTGATKYTHAHAQTHAYSYFTLTLPPKQSYFYTDCGPHNHSPLCKNLVCKIFIHYYQSAEKVFYYYIYIYILYSLIPNDLNGER